MVFTGKMSLPICGLLVAAPTVASQHRLRLDAGHLGRLRLGLRSGPRPAVERYYALEQEPDQAVWDSRMLAYEALP
jgi:hypothetical protein